jgi:3-deoxy-D-arabino-heptulosonate 7-phosphate (DAHP) synthase
MTNVNYHLISNQPKTPMFNDLFNRKPEDKPFLISGPCSAETEEQVLETCRRC